MKPYAEGTQEEPDPVGDDQNAPRPAQFTLAAGLSAWSVLSLILGIPGGIVLVLWLLQLVAPGFLILATLLILQAGAYVALVTVRVAWRRWHQATQPWNPRDFGGT